MLFNSYEFIFIFLPLTLIGYFLFAKYRFTKLAIAWLVFASLAFYSYWDIRYLPLLVISILFNFTAGSFIEKTRNKKILTFAIIINLCLLGYYKYTGFFLESINHTFKTSLFVPDIVLPLGISFFTFTQTAYLVDAYRGETKNYSLITYSLFVTIFPHLIAGPILYHKDMIPQFSNLRNFIFSYKNIDFGICIFSIGLFKKVVIADSLSPFVGGVFDATTMPTFLDAWTATLAYTFQIYFDFSGYSDMAIGLGKMFNFSLPVNFNSPYQATNIIDFWRRWHMTLSSFLKNYLYIPLGGSRKGIYRRYTNLILVMLIGGLWHGAGWNFVFWGGLHGFYLSVNHWWKNTELGLILPRKISWGLTFLCIMVAWIFFRVPSIERAWEIIGAMIGFYGVDLPIMALVKVIVAQKIAVLSPSDKTSILNLLKFTNKIVLLAVVCTIALKTDEAWKWMEKNHSNLNYIKYLILGIILSISILCLTRPTEFLYFQF